ncbi:MAG: hypothetical protein K2H87_03835 [Duncaniella sp.]|nr:hypothetical protein [Duncaniella sp.]
MKTENPYRSLAALAAEVEGRLMVMESRREGDTSLILELLAEKATLLQGGIMALPYDNKVEPEETETPEETISPISPIGPISPISPIEATEAPEVTETAASPSSPETLDERLARERARDINKAFTLNDKFRFRRDLFRGSETDFDETLDVISGMADFSEAEEYFYDDLCWDPEDPAVKEFMEIVARHF